MQAGSREEARAVIEKVAREVTATEIMNWILREMPNLTPDDYSSVSNVVRDAMTEEILGGAAAVRFNSLVVA
jgi:hypothetical protein